MICFACPVGLCLGSGVAPVVVGLFSSVAVGTYPKSYSRCSGAHAASKDPLRAFSTQIARSPAQPGPGHGTERKSRATSLPGDAMRRSHPRTRTQPMLASERSGGARLSTMRTTIVRVMADLASLHTHPPLACGLRSVSMTRSTMSLQGQAEQPMVLRGRSVSSIVPDAPVPWPWTRAAGRVWLAAGRLGSKRSRTSAQLAACWPGGHRGMPVWPLQGSGSLLLAALGL